MSKSQKLPKEKEYLVLENLNLVHYVLNKRFNIKPYNQDYDDYYQEGCIGLIISAIRYDENKGFKFSTFAYSNICGCVSNYIREKCDIIRIPRNKYSVVMKVVSLFAQGFSTSEIERITGVSEYNIQQFLNSINVGTLDMVINDDSKQETTLINMIPSSENDAYEEMISEDYMVNCVSKVTSKLKLELHINIWEEYVYSLFYGEKLNREYFANKYNTSHQNVTRILRKCKKMFSDVIDKDNTLMS